MIRIAVAKMLLSRVVAFLEIVRVTTSHVTLSSTFGRATIKGLVIEIATELRDKMPLTGNQLPLTGGQAARMSAPHP